MKDRELLALALVGVAVYLLWRPTGAKQSAPDEQPPAPTLPPASKGIGAPDKARDPFADLHQTPATPASKGAQAPAHGGLLGG